MIKTIDQRLDEMLDHELGNRPLGRAVSIRTWGWRGCPGPFSDNANIPFDVDVKVYLEIMRASVDECIRSDSDYVRQCKSWIARKEELIKTNLM
jgi:hypothetical protein